MVNPVVNSDDSSSRQSLNCTNLDNYLTNSSSSEEQIEQEEDDNFGKIIKKNTIVESVTA